VVVEAGFTAWVPPAACKLYVLPSEPANVTCEEFKAVIVRIDELPAAIDVGLAAMLTVGAGLVTALTVTVTVAVALVVEPVAVAV